MQSQKASALTILAIFVFLEAIAFPAVAQETIQVKTNEVLVPTLVIDKVRLEDSRREGSDLAKAVYARKIELANILTDSIEIKDLTSDDFRVFEDGRSQKVRNVSRRRSAVRNVRDNRGIHTEFVGSGGGKWSTLEWQGSAVWIVNPPGYLVSYAPPDSPEGSCHKVRIEVNRRHAVVLSRSEYCNTKHSATDPLNGTPIGLRMSGELGPSEGHKSALFLAAVPFEFTESDARIHVTLDWPPALLDSGNRSLFMLGVVTSKDGRREERFSDVSDFDPGGVERHNSVFGDDSASNFPLTRYETQIVLPFGEYKLQMILSDGKHFAQAEKTILLEPPTKETLTIGSLALCKQIEKVFDHSSTLSDTAIRDWMGEPPRDYVPLISNGVEFVVSGDTRFKRDEPLYIYFEVFDSAPTSVPSDNVFIQIRVVNQQSGELQSAPESISVAPYIVPGTPMIPVGRGISIRLLPKGSYRLDVRATDSTTGRSTPWRSTAFTVD